VVVSRGAVTWCYHVVVSHRNHLVTNNKRSSDATLTLHCVITRNNAVFMFMYIRFFFLARIVWNENGALWLTKMCFYF
jgi:hypothetical protein